MEAQRPTWSPSTDPKDIARGTAARADWNSFVDFLRLRVDHQVEGSEPVETLSTLTVMMDDYINAAEDAVKMLTDELLDERLLYRDRVRRALDIVRAARHLTIGRVVHGTSDNTRG